MLDHTSTCSQADWRPFAVLPTLPSSLPAWQALGRGALELPGSPSAPSEDRRAAGVSR